jgi:predicted lipid-binding transport protein (Tim44 family)
MSVFPTVHYESLLETFTKAVDAFNNQDFSVLERLLHPNAVLNRIHHRKDADTVRGRADVIKYLTDKLKADKTQFTPVAPISVSIRTGTVSGTGQWEDPQGTKPEKISYSFIFTQDINTNEWSLLNMDAAQQS